jgi:proteasome accessory factor B
MPAADKLHRWLDLISALLRRRMPATFDNLRADVPAYDGQDVKADSVLRMFERDKDELRELGVPIETVPTSDGDSAYRLKPGNFYLPLLSICEAMLPGSTEVRQVPRRPDGLGYASLPNLVLTPDECLMLQRAAARVKGLAHSELADDATRAMRKLQFDVETFAIELPSAATVAHAAADSEDFEVLGDARALRKCVRFAYHSMGRDQVAVRTVEPYGLLFLTGHWYLVACDVSSGGVRQFRVSRIRDATLVNSQRQHPDFELPAGFDLAAHAASRQAWELGDGDGIDAVVAFRGQTGQVLQGLQLGTPIGPSSSDVTTPDVQDRRRFVVRRRDPFLRWLLTFAGDARPASPPQLVDEWRALLTATRTAHQRAGGAA